MACELSETRAGTVAEIVDAETLKLTDGTVVRLIGAKAPRAPLSWRGDDPWPMVKEARDALSELAAGADVELQFGGRQADRHGRALAHVFATKGGKRLWLQEELVAQGLARVYSFPDNRACFTELLARETEARDQGLGVWRSWAYRVREAKDVERLGRLKHSYQLVEGVVVAVGGAGGRTYLNFTKDWRTDFTIVVERKNVAAFKKAGLDLQALAGKRVRVRGWLGWRNGPMVEASHPEQIEMLAVEPGSGPARPEGRS